MKKIILLAIVLILVVGCSAPKFICPDGTTVVDDKAKCPPAAAKDTDSDDIVSQPVKVDEKVGSVPVSNDENDDNGDGPAVTATKPAAATTAVMDKEIQKLIDSTAKLTSYQFIYQYGTQQAMKYTVLGDKVGVEIMFGNPLYDKYGYYDRAALDTREKTAIIYCAERSACDQDDKKVGKKVPYEVFSMPVDPIALMKSMGADAKITGELTCDRSNPCKIIKFKEGGQDVEMHVDEYYGFPYYWSKGGVEMKLSSFVAIPKNPQVTLPETVTEIIE